MLVWRLQRSDVSLRGDKMALVGFESPEELMNIGKGIAEIDFPGLGTR
jgi:hypothetical protein